MILATTSIGGVVAMLARRGRQERKLVEEAGQAGGA
jgi:hypothetical protein